MDDLFTRQVVWLVQLSQLPAWRDHARFRMRLLLADPSGLWQGLSEAVRQQLGPAAASASAAPSPTKPP